MIIDQGPYKDKLGKKTEKYIQRNRIQRLPASRKILGNASKHKIRHKPKQQRSIQRIHSGSTSSRGTSNSIERNSGEFRSRVKSLQRRISDGNKSLNKNME